jgi:CRP-like cAMP-binding protein
MKIDDIIAILRRNPLFRPVRQDRLRFMVLSGAEQQLAGGEMLFDRGDEGDAAYVVLSGAVQPIIKQGGRDIPLARLGPGELFGEIAVLCDKARTAAIIADGPTAILRLEADALSDLLQEFPDLALEFIRSLATRLEATSLALAEARAAAPA